MLEPINPPIKPDKGLYNGSCNRTACQQPGATWYNSSTRKYYCKPCAFRINDANKQILCKEHLTAPRPACASPMCFETVDVPGDYCQVCRMQGGSE